MSTVFSYSFISEHEREKCMILGCWVDSRTKSHDKLNSLQKLERLDLNVSFTDHEEIFHAVSTVRYIFCISSVGVPTPYEIDMSVG